MIFDTVLQVYAYYMYTLLGYVISDVFLCTLQEKGDMSLEEQPQRVYMESPVEQKR